MTIPNLWRTQKQRYSLQGEVCPHCSSAIFPPRRVCPYCKRTAQAVQQNDAFAYSYTMQIPVTSNVAIAGDD